MSYSGIRHGAIEVVCGPMFSGKTKYLISKYNETLNDFWHQCVNEHMIPNKKYYNKLYQPNHSYHTSQVDFYNANKDSIILAINYYKDTRYGDNLIVSHNGDKIPSINCENIHQIFDASDKLDKCSYIFINEAQFFQDLKKSVIKLIEEHDKHVIICGLDSDYKREKFGDMWDLIPHSNKIIKLNGKCSNCENHSICTHRITNETNQELIGNTNYIPLCRNCYIKQNP